MQNSYALNLRFSEGDIQLGRLPQKGKKSVPLFNPIGLEMESYLYEVDGVFTVSA